MLQNLDSVCAGERVELVLSKFYLGFLQTRQIILGFIGASILPDNIALEDDSIRQDLWDFQIVHNARQHITNTELIGALQSNLWIPNDPPGLQVCVN